MRHEIIRLLTVILLIAASTSMLMSEVKMIKENPNNPGAVIKTSMGDIYIELFPDAAPDTVKNFLDLAEGRKEFSDSKTGAKAKRNFYDGLIFHRVIDNFMVQGGCPTGTGTGSPGFKFADEISGRALGLDKIKAHTEDGIPHSWLLVRSQVDYQQNILLPLYKKIGITSEEDFNKKKGQLTSALKDMTILDAFQNMGYRYSNVLKSRHPLRGVIAMANSGPDSNGSQFFINIIDTPWLTGKHTVFGMVVGGMDIVDKMSKVKVRANSSPETPVTIISIREWTK